MRIIMPCIMLGLCVAMSGCAVAQSPSGRYVLGIGVASEPGSAADAAAKVGRVMGGLGMPAGGLIGDALGVVLAATGFGVAGRQFAAAKAARAQRDGERAGWDEAMMDTSLRLVGAPAVAVAS